MNEKKEILKHYLLGTLDKTTTEKIDLKIIAEEETEEKLLIAEQSLIEDFLEKNLTANEVKFFRKNFLISPEREAQVREISDLKKYSHNYKLRKNAEISSLNEPDSFFDKLRRFFTFQPVRAIAAMLIIGIFFGVIWLSTFKTNHMADLSTLEIEYAKLNKQDLRSLEKYANNAQLNIIHGAPRSADQQYTFEKKAITEQTLFRLSLPGTSPENEVYRIAIQNDDKTVFRQIDITPIKNVNGEELRFLIPSSILDKGDYLINVTNLANSEFVYPFAIN